MNTTAIYIRTQPEVKEKAQKVARDLGISLSSLMNAWLKQLVRTKTVSFSVADEEPNDYVLSAMKQAEKNIKKGKHSPIFKTGEEAVQWLEKQGV